MKSHVYLDDDESFTVENYKILKPNKKISFQKSKFLSSITEFLVNVLMPLSAIVK